MKTPSEQLASAKLGDPRRTRRLAKLADVLSQAPDLSFPDAFKGDAELEGCYRFLNNPYSSMAKILQPHIQEVVQQASLLTEDIVVAHDTTEFNFKGDGEREGLGRMQDNNQGFFAHVALATAVSDGLQNPLGVVGLETLHRKPLPKDLKNAPRKSPGNDNEHLRWARQMLAADALLKKGKRRPIHVADREAGSWSNHVALQDAGCRYVIRARANRRLDDPTGRIGDFFDLLEEGSPNEIVREVDLSSRKATANKTKAKKQPPRRSRSATLRIQAAKIVLKKPSNIPIAENRRLEMNMIYVTEIEPPEGEPAVNWVLTTSEAIGTPEEVAKIVDYYRGRWLIEEFFKALKTGCSFEKRQLESKHALENALAIFIPIASQILRLRWLSRGEQGTAPASDVLDPPHLKALTVLQPAMAKTWSETPTVREVMLTIAKQGGHLKQNGDPGWQVLGRGWISFLQFFSGWEAALRAASQYL